MRVIHILRTYPPIIITYVFTLIMYFVGIGPVSLIGKLLGVQFIEKYKGSTWVSHQVSRSHDRMY